MPDNAVHIFNTHASFYAEKYMDVSQYHAALDVFCDSIKQQNASLLELACGPGNVTKYLLSKRPDLDILATDLAPNMLQIAKETNPSIQIQLLDCRRIRSLNRTFDAVVCAFATPYLSKEQTIQMIHDVSSILNAGGAFYISTMEDDYSKSGWQTSSKGDSVYMYYHEAGYLIKAMEESGLRLLYQSTIPAPVNGDTDLLLIATKT
jgi:cyclopropane fatty-acyl-phospholipid synthase-like methyltransferase